MKKHFLLLFLGITITLNAQIETLDVPEIKKEQTEWCWAAASKSVLEFYGHSKRVHDKIPIQTTILYSEISFLIRCCFPLL